MLDNPPSFSSLHGKESLDSFNYKNGSGWAHLTTKSLCRNVSQVLPIPKEVKANESITSNQIEHPSDIYKSSETLCQTKSTRNSFDEKCKWWNRIHVLVSVTSTLLLILFLILEWVPNILNGSDSSENATSITYTNVVITPCGNYFWHSAGGPGGNWQSSDLASKNDEKLLEEMSTADENLGYNRIIGKSGNWPYRLKYNYQMGGRL